MEAPHEILLRVLQTLRRRNGGKRPTQHELGAMLGVPNRTFDRYLSGASDQDIPARVVFDALGLIGRKRP